jgi:signal transduction histidine kinase
LRAQDEERRRIARDLHDSSGQILVAVQMNLAPLEEQARKMSPEFAAGIKQSMELVEQLSKELRTVSYLLHPPLLDEAGLPSALRWYLEGFAERSKIDVQMEVPPDLGRLPGDMEMTIFRIVQESLTNIHRHSGGRRAEIRLERSANEVRLEIQDNGQGMPRSNNGGGARTPRAGVGIQGMRERVKQLGGRLEIESNGSGTAVNVSLPLGADVAG